MAYNLPRLEGAIGGGKLTLPTQSSYLAGKEKESYRKGGKSANQITTEIKTEPLPQSVIESLAQALLPQMQDFFKSEQGKQAVEKWHKEKLREELKASILQAELEHPKYSREDIIEWISRFKYGDPDNKEYPRQIIDIFLNSIYVFDDRLVFTYNYKNGAQTVTLADVSAVFGSDLESCTPPE